MEHWLEELRDHADPNIVIMLVGNKLDLSESSRQVSTEQGGALAEQEGFLFVETSALDATNVDKAFSTVFDTIYSDLPKKQAGTQKEHIDRPLQGERIQLRPPNIRGGHDSIHGQNSSTVAAAAKGGCCWFKQLYLHLQLFTYIHEIKYHSNLAWYFLENVDVE